ncbi:MAG: hypothetical protein JSW00_08955 [Thermoplasmata archaeon]|nr:MAG: hypothetical protein JSW00_08955 [Thermoplasmata archaeon]
MGLESFTYITSLNSSNPVGASDTVAEGDDHIRGLKTVLLASFPSISGAVTLTHTQINDAAQLAAANAFTAANTFDGSVSILGGNSLVIKDSTNVDDVTVSHDGTDLNIVGTTTTDINITGITAIAAGTVDADFDAITATSYGGITEANLVDKTASETISGATWDFQALTAVTFGGIASANLLDKSATETVSGNWTFSGTLNSKDPDDFAEESVALSATNTDAAQPGFKGAPINTQNGNYTLVLADAGKIIRKASGGAGETITIPANASVAFPTGTIIEIQNDGGGDLSIAITSDTLEQWATGSTGTRTLSDNNKAVIEKVSSTAWKYGSTDQ